jgi:hypothetical protein
MEVAMKEEFLSQQDLAIRWALHVQTLTKWRTSPTWTTIRQTWKNRALRDE